MLFNLVHATRHLALRQRLRLRSRVPSDVRAPAVVPELVLGFVPVLVPPFRMTVPLVCGL